MLQVRRILGPFGRTVQRHEVKHATTDDEPLLQHIVGKAGTREEQPRRTVERVRARAQPNQVRSVFRDIDGIGGHASQRDLPAIGREGELCSPGRAAGRAYQAGMRRTS